MLVNLTVGTQFPVSVRVKNIGFDQQVFFAELQCNIPIYNIDTYIVLHTFLIIFYFILKILIHI